MVTWLANQSDHVTCQPGTIAIGNAASFDACSSLPLGNDFGDTGDGVESGELGVGVVVMYSVTSWLRV